MAFLVHTFARQINNNYYSYSAPTISVGPLNATFFLFISCSRRWGIYRYIAAHVFFRIDGTAPRRFKCRWRSFQLKWFRINKTKQKKTRKTESRGNAGWTRERESQVIWIFSGTIVVYSNLNTSRTESDKSTHKMFPLHRTVTANCILSSKNVCIRSHCGAYPHPFTALPRLPPTPSSSLQRKSQ